MGYNSGELLEQCTNAIIPHNCYILLPLHNNECDDFEFSFGQSWHLLWPLLVDLGYVEEVSSEVNVVVSKLASLTHRFTNKHKLHFSYK